MLIRFWYIFCAHFLMKINIIIMQHHLHIAQHVFKTTGVYWLFHNCTGLIYVEEKCILLYSYISSDILINTASYI